jgi:hypothetical protein
LKKKGRKGGRRGGREGGRERERKKKRKRKRERKSQTSLIIYNSFLSCKTSLSWLLRTPPSGVLIDT